MDHFKNKKIPDIGNLFDRNFLCGIAQDKSTDYMERMKEIKTDEIYEGHKGCYGMSCGNCILKDNTDFNTWLAHLRMVR